MIQVSYYANNMRLHYPIEVAPTSNEMMTYENAKLYVLFYKHNGHRDWRLPTLQEWLNHNPPLLGWEDYAEHSSDIVRYVTPVRDIK